MTIRYDAILTAKSVAEMQAAGQFNDGQPLILTVAGDAVMYLWDDDSTATDEASTTAAVVAVTGQTTGRWIRAGGGTTNVTASTLAVATLGNTPRVYTINAAAGCAVTLPAATGTGNAAEFILGTTVTSNTTVIAVNGTPGTDTMTGNSVTLADAGATLVGYEAGATADTITFDGSTTGGLKGDRVLVRDIASGLWFVQVFTAATGTEATPFSAAVP